MEENVTLFGHFFHPTKRTRYRSSYLGLVILPWQKSKPVTLDSAIRAHCDDLGGNCAVSLSGRLTIDSAPDVLTLFLRRLESPSCHSLTIHFDDVAYVDTSGLAVLVEALKAARARGKGFYITGLRERPRYLLEATRMLHLFQEVHPDMPTGGVA